MRKLQEAGNDIMMFIHRTLYAACPNIVDGIIVKANDWQLEPLKYRCRYMHEKIANSR